MKRSLAIIGMLCAAGLVVYWLHVSNNRFYIVATSRGITYEVDKKTGQIWVLDQTSKTLLQANREGDVPHGLSGWNGTERVSDKKPTSLVTIRKQLTLDEITQLYRRWLAGQQLKGIPISNKQYSDSERKTIILTTSTLCR